MNIHGKRNIFFEIFLLINKGSNEMFQIPTELTIPQWWWFAIAILLAALSGQYGEKAKHNLWLIEKLERKEEESIKPEYNVIQAKLVYAVAILIYIISLVMMLILSPY